jgi:Tannase and feruloyl esterase
LIKVNPVPFFLRRNKLSKLYLYIKEVLMFIRTLTLGLVPLILGGCGSQQNSPPVISTVSCANLSGMTISSSAIGLPTGGAAITSSSVVSSTSAGNSNGEYCLVTGNILPASTDPSGTPNIKFQLNLPTKWNQKTVQMGGGGYNGTVVTGTGAISFAPGSIPLAEGYATFGSDSGHVGTSTDATFAVNDGAILNFGYMHIKKTHDTAFQIINIFYGNNPIRSYFAGGSTGGREAMTAVERFPQDYDGVVASAPALNFSGVRLHGVAVGQAAYAPGGYLSLTKQSLVFNTAISMCDSLDGATDGIVSNVSACKSIQNQVLAKLRCSDGTDQGSTCLSDAQINTVKTIQNDFQLPYTLSYGVNSHKGYNILQGADYTSSSLGLGGSPTRDLPPLVADNGYLFTQGDSYLKYFITRNTSFDSFTYNLNLVDNYLPQLINMSSIVGAMNPDLSAFQKKGSKIIMMHGLQDQVISNNDTIAYYDAQLANNGKSYVDSFIRFINVPGLGHGSGVFTPSWQAIDILDNWVNSGIAPTTIIGTDTNASTLNRTRPMCFYPYFPKYNGSGDVNSASNFTCSIS